MTDDELSLVETTRLIDALGRRFSGVLVVTVKTLGKDGDGATTFWRGGWVTALGLAKFAEHDIATARALKRTTEDS